MTPPKDQAPGLVAAKLREGVILCDQILHDGVALDLNETDELMLKGAEAIEQLEAENAELRGKLERVEKTLTTAMQLAAMDLREQANIRSPVQSQIREPYEGEDGA